MTDSMPGNPTLSGSSTVGLALIFETVLSISNPNLAFTVSVPISPLHSILSLDQPDLRSLVDELESKSDYFRSPFHSYIHYFNHYFYIPSICKPTHTFGCYYSINSIFLNSMTFCNYMIFPLFLMIFCWNLRILLATHHFDHLTFSI